MNYLLKDIEQTILVELSNRIKGNGPALFLNWPVCELFRTDLQNTLRFISHTCKRVGQICHILLDHIGLEQLQQGIEPVSLSELFIHHSHIRKI